MNLDEWRQLTDEERAVLKDFQQSQIEKFGKDPFNGMLDKYDAAGAWTAAKNGEMSAMEAQGQLAGAGIELTPEQTDYLNNAVAAEAADKANAFTEKMRDSSITSAAKQYEELGLNPAHVVSTGGAGIGSSSMAETSKNNVAENRAMNDMNNKAAMTRTILGIVGGLANAGIHGGAIMAARSAASKLASATAHSGETVLQQHFNKNGVLTRSIKTNRSYY